MRTHRKYRVLGTAKLKFALAKRDVCGIKGKELLQTCPAVSQAGDARKEV